MEFVGLRLKATQLAEIRNYVAKVTGQQRIAKVDGVVALFARCLSEVEPEARPIDTVSFVVNVRSLVASPAARLILSQHRGWGIHPVNAMLNALIWFPVELQTPKSADPRDIIVAHAAEIRQGMGKLKDRRLIRDLVAGVAKIQSQVAWDKVGQDLANADESSLVANVIWR